MSISVFPFYMSHESGTKFYEVVRLTNDDNGRSIVFNRWGKVNDFHHGGGQTKQESFDNGFSADQAATQKVAEKEKRGYKRDRSDFNLHRFVTQQPDASFDARVSAHYGRAMVGTVYKALGIDPNAAVTKSEKVAPQPPAVEINRGEQWGAWA